MSLPRVQWLRRASHVARIFARFGFASILQGIGLRRFARGRRDRPEPGSRLDLPVRLRLALVEIGPTAVKLGQILSSRSDVLPIEYIHELRTLTDEVPPFPYEQAKEIIEADLGRPIVELYEEFDPTPAASASIGQVHFAVLPGGRRVAVKVLRPGIIEQVELDLQLLLWAADEAQRHSSWGRRSGVREVAEELAYTLRNELNFAVEAHNTDLLRRSLEGDDRVLVPEVYWDLSSRRVLTLQRMEGAKAADPQGLARTGVDRVRAAQRLATVILRQIFEIGSFHADPHGGNILFNSRSQVVMLDCANVGRIGSEMRRDLVFLLRALIEGDAREAANMVLHIGAPGRNTDMQRLYLDLQVVLSRYGGTRSVDVGIREILDRTMHVIVHNQVRMPPSFATIVKALVMMEGVCLQLDPGFDFPETTRAAAEEILPETGDPLHLLRQFVETLREYQRYAAVLPRRVHQFLSKAEAGGISVRLEYDEIDRPMRQFAAIFNRLSMSIIVSSFILASAWIIARGGLPRLGGLGDAVVYTVAIIGCLLGAWLVISFVRSR